MRARKSSTVWASGCDSWYLDADGDALTWPFTWKKWVAMMQSVFTEMNSEYLESREDYIEALEGQIERLRETVGDEAAEEVKPGPADPNPAAANANAHEFNHFLFKIIAFKAERGNYQISKEEFPELHNWMQSLKREYKHHTMEPATCSLTEEQLKVLEFLHIPVTSRGDDHWNRFYGKFD